MFQQVLPCLNMLVRISLDFLEREVHEDIFMCGIIKRLLFYDTHDVFSYRSIGIGFFAEAVVPVASNSTASRMMRMSFMIIGLCF